MNRKRRSDYRGLANRKKVTTDMRKASLGMALLGMLVQLLGGCVQLEKKGEVLRYAPGRMEDNHRKSDYLVKKGLIQRRPDNLASSREYWTAGDRPKSCLALSGGGIRSATFSIGVLEELTKAGVLAKTDIISAVSGGSYALSWFYMQHYNARKLGNDKLTDQEKAEVQDVMFRQFVDPTNHKRFFTEADYAAAFVFNLPLIPAHLVANGVFSWRANVGLPSALYEHKLAETFHRTPNIESSKVPTTYELGQFARKSGLPAFIITTTAWLGNIDPNQLKLHDTVFSFSPVHYGSGAYGMYRYPDDPDARDKYKDLKPLKLNEVVALSGAALDFAAFLENRTWQTLVSALAIDMGGYIDNPAVGPDQRLLHQILPFPFYLASRHTPDLAGIGIYLSDGGHSENLGVYPLVIRGCEKIIVVDGEEDPYYEFGAYFLLQKRLKDELGLNLHVAQIEDGLHTKKLGGANITQIKEILRNHELLKDTLYEEEPTFMPRWKQYADAPVMDGTISGPDGHQIKITYLKLAYKPRGDLTDPANKDDLSDPANQRYWDFLRQVDPATKFYNTDFGPPECNEQLSSDPVANYYYCIKQARVLKLRPLYVAGVTNPFPQQQTVGQNYSPEEVDAYVKLGNKIAREFLTHTGMLFARTGGAISATQGSVLGRQ
jgi:hypothetical protein